MTDEQKLVNLLLSDPDRFGMLMDRYGDLVWKIALRMSGEIGLAQDIYQNTFIKVYEGLHTFKFKSKLSTWIGRICYNESVDFLKSRNKYQFHAKLAEDLIDTGESEQEESFQKSVQRKHIEEGLEKLSPVQATIVELYHFKNFKYEEISAILDLPIGTVKNYLFRARKKLKIILEDMEETKR